MVGEGADTKRRQTQRPRASGRRARRGSKVARDFYGSALDAAERIELAEAAEVEGLDKEIAVLRMKLRDVLVNRPEELQLMLRGIELLVKAVSARYRLSKDAEEDLAGSIAGVVRGVGELLLPEGTVDE